MAGPVGSATGGTEMPVRQQAVTRVEGGPKVINPPRGGGRFRPLNGERGRQQKMVREITRDRSPRAEMAQEASRGLAAGARGQ